MRTPYLKFCLDVALRSARKPTLAYVEIQCPNQPQKGSLGTQLLRQGCLAGILEGLSVLSVQIC